MLEKLNRLLCYITLATFAGHLDVGRMCHKTPTNLAELSLKLFRSHNAKGSGTWSCLYHLSD